MAEVKEISFSNDNGLVKRTRIIETENQVAPEITNHGPYQKIDSDLQLETLNLGQEIQVNFEWKIMDLTNGEYIVDAERSEDFTIKIDGQEIVVPFGDFLLLSSNESGPMVVEIGNDLKVVNVLEIY